LFAITADSRTEVDRITEKVLSLGSVEPSPKEEYPHMYGRSFIHPDVHAWEPFYYNESALPKD
jgi:predicted lactoylglutathione lyase